MSSNRPINYHPITLQLLQKYITIDITEMKCYSCNGHIKEDMDVIFLTKISQMKMHHEDCGLAKNIKVKMEDIKYHIFAKDKK